MTKLGTTPAIRDLYNMSCRANSGHLRNPLRLLRSVRSRKLYEESCRAFRRNSRLFSMNDQESAFLSGLLAQGHAVAPGFFSKELIDRLYARADGIFHRDFGEPADTTPTSLRAPKATNQGRHVRFGRDRVLELPDPLVAMPDTLDIVFHESILKIAAHYFRHIPHEYAVSVVRCIPNHQPKCLTSGGATNEHRRSLLIVIDLADIDETRAPLLYIPPSENLQIHGSPPQNSPHNLAADIRPRQTTRDKWVLVRGERGSIIALPHTGGHNAIWTYPADISNKPRTSIIIDIRAFHREDTPAEAQNWMLKWNFDRLTDLQKMFAYPAFFDEPVPGLAKVS